MTDPTPRRARRSSPKGEARRREILDAALRMFAAGGFHSASIADIADAVGITQAGLLHHFPSKGELLLAVLQERDERNLADEDRRRRDGRTWADSFIATLASNDRSPGLTQLFAVLSAESVTDGHPAHGWFVERYRHLVEKVTAGIAEDAGTDGLPDGVTAETVARWMIALADGLRLQSLLDPDSPARADLMVDFVRAVAPTLADGIRTDAELPEGRQR